MRWGVRGGGRGELIIMGGAGGRTSPLGSGQTGLERGEVQVSLSLRNGFVSPACLFPRHQPAATFRAGGPSLGKAPLPHLPSAPT